MRTWLINCKTQITYEIDAETEEEAQEIGKKLFVIDVCNMSNNDIEVETE